jgi:hypothetical protein
MKSKKLMEAVEDYNPYCQAVTYSTIFAMMLAKNNKFRVNIINCSSAGGGKTRSTADLQEILKIPNTTTIKGYVTPYRLFKTLVEHPNDLIIMDEMERTLENPQAQFILRSALYGGEVCWQSKTDSDTYRFNGTLVANLNKLPALSDKTKALYDRCFVNKIELNNKQIVEKIKHTRTYDPKRFIGPATIIKKRILEARSGLKELTEQEEDEIYAFVEDKILGAKEQASVRAIQKTKLIFQCTKTLFGGFDKDTKKLAFGLAEPHVLADEPKDRIYEFAKRISNENGEVNYKSLVKLISGELQISERHARRLIKNCLNLEKKNRKIIVAKCF